MLEERPAYDYALKALEDYVNLAMTVSGFIHNLPVDTRSFWASILFAKLCVTSVSMVHLLPANRRSPSGYCNWDASSISTLARNVIENYHGLFYLCIEKISEEDWQCRLRIIQLHDCLTRKKLFQDMGDNEEPAKFEGQANELRDILKQNNVFQGFNATEQKKLLKGEQAFYLSRGDIEQRIRAGMSNIRMMYRLLSIQVHTLPMSFYRTIEQRRGTGVETSTELHYINMAIEYTIPYLQLATRQLIELYPSAKQYLSEQQVTLLNNDFVQFDDLN